MTQINKELLEKYELGQCTDQESKLVLDWLENEDWDQLAPDSVPADINNEEGTQLWNKLTPLFQKQEQPRKTLLRKGLLSITATIVFLILGYVTIYHYRVKQELNDSQYSNIVHISHPFTLVLGKNSQANIDIKTGIFTLSGEVLFTPNKDLILQHGEQSGLHFKAGETYYLAESRDPGRIIIIKKEDFTFLPAIVQKQIRKQFQLS